MVLHSFFSFFRWGVLAPCNLYLVQCGIVVAVLQCTSNRNKMDYL